MDAAPFRALRYDPAVAGTPATTSAPAYDELDRDAYGRHRAASPYTVLELLAPRGQEGGYATAGATYARWRRTGVLVEEPAPAFYRYEQHELRRGVPAVQRGVLAAVRLEPIGATGSGGGVLPHEDVEDYRVADRLDRLSAVPADLSPVFALHEHGSDAYRRLLARPPRTPPLAAFTDETGIDHRVWALRDPDDVAVIREALAPMRVVIADGHHRYASALALRDRRAEDARARGGAVTGDEPWQRTLLYLVDAREHGPEVLAIHRLLPTFPDDGLARLDAAFTASGAVDDAPALAAQVAGSPDRVLGLWLPGSTRTRRATGHLLRLRDPAVDAHLPSDRSPHWRSLDAAIADHVALPLLGAPSPQYRTDVQEAAAELGARGEGALLLLRPVDAGTVWRLAAAGEPMPPKTTHFRPKPRVGLTMRATG